MPNTTTILTNAAAQHTAQQMAAEADSTKNIVALGEKIITGDTKGLDFKAMLDHWLEQAIGFGIRVVIAFIVFYIFRWVIKALVKWFRKWMNYRHVSPGLTSFLSSLFHGLAFVLLIIVLVEILGIKSVSFAALMAALGVAIGAALSGQLQNLAAGVVILTTRPFRVGDWIESKGAEGTVTDISIFYTTLHSIDNSSIHIPNAVVTSDKIINTSSQTTRRCQWIMGVEYNTDVDMVKQTMLSVIDGDKRILSNPPVLVVVRELADSSVNVMMRAWCNSEDYWPLMWEVNEKLYKVFNDKKISFAFPSMTIYQGGDRPMYIDVNNHVEGDHNGAPEAEKTTQQ